jgi:Fe2+ transport system protein FeoA
MPTLAQLAPGATAVVHAYPQAGPAFTRLREMGLLPGTPVKLIRIAPLGDPIEIQVRGYRLSLRKSEAALVEITPAP